MDTSNGKILLAALAALGIGAALGAGAHVATVEVVEADAGAPVAFDVPNALTCTPGEIGSDRYGRVIRASCPTTVDTRYAPPCADGAWITYAAVDPDGTLALTNTRCASDPVERVRDTIESNQPGWWGEPVQDAPAADAPDGGR